MYIISIVEHLSEMSLNIEGKILKCVSKTFSLREIYLGQLLRDIIYLLQKSSLWYLSI